MTWITISSIITGPTWVAIPFGVNAILFGALWFNDEDYFVWR
jgi:hypothetical protein